MKISAVIPTCETKWNQGLTFCFFSKLHRKPDEVIVVLDADKEAIESDLLFGVPVKIIHTKVRGAAIKRNLGVKNSSGEAVLFVDDDVEFFPNSVQALEEILEANNTIGGVGCFIKNQSFSKPRIYSYLVFKLSGGWRICDFSGKCFGPMINLFPQAKGNSKKFIKSDWLNTTMTLYRRKALPCPVFDLYFSGYSYGEDLALSLRVKKQWQIGNATESYIVHHSKPSSYKANQYDLQKMIIKNKFYILTKIQNSNQFSAAILITWVEILYLPLNLIKKILQNSKKSLRGVLSGLIEIWMYIFFKHYAQRNFL